MTLTEALAKRRSVRSFTGEQISREELDTILKAACAAPVGMGRYEDAHLTIITNKQLLDDIKRSAGALDRDVLYGAPMLIVVSQKRPDSSAMDNVMYSNAAIIVQNMALAATELGVGACHIWGATMAMSADAELTRRLALPHDFVPCSAIALGKTEVKYEAREIPLERIARNAID